MDLGPKGVSMSNILSSIQRPSDKCQECLNHEGFVSWRVDHFSFGQMLSGKFHYFV